MKITKTRAPGKLRLRLTFGSATEEDAIRADMLALLEEMHEELAFGLAASYIGDLPDEVFDQLHDRLQRVDAVIKRAKGGGE